MSDRNELPHQRTRRVMVGTVPLGAGAPCAVQSMLTVSTQEVEKALAQIEELAEAGCEIVRIAIPHKTDIPSFEALCKASSLPVVADIHFDAEIAVRAAHSGAAKLRINPGNVGGLEKTDAIIAAAQEVGIPIRIGVNAGSLDTALANQTSMTLPQKLAQSAASYVRYFEERGFTNMVVSAKAHDVITTIATYRYLAQDIPQIPLHIGITEAGTLFQGLIKSACGLGVLLEEGIGDTLRISLTDDPLQEIRACWALLSALGLRRRYPELVSCPTCGRCQVDLISLAQQVEEKIKNIPKPLQVAVMGCVVNGPGEASDADIGVACGAGSGLVFAQGKILRKVDEDAILETLMEEIGKL